MLQVEECLVVCLEEWAEWAEWAEWVCNSFFIREPIFQVSNVKQKFGFHYISGVFNLIS